MLSKKVVFLGMIAVALLAGVSEGIARPWDIVRCISVGMGSVAWLQVIKAAIYRANLSENAYVRGDILIKEFILAGFVALNVGTVYGYLVKHHAPTLIAPVTIVLYSFLIYVHLSYKAKRDRIDRNDVQEVSDED